MRGKPYDLNYSGSLGELLASPNLKEDIEQKIQSLGNSANFSLVKRLYVEKFLATGARLAKSDSLGNPPRSQLATQKIQILILKNKELLTALALELARIRPADELKDYFAVSLKDNNPTRFKIEITREGRTIKKVDLLLVGEDTLDELPANPSSAVNPEIQ